MSYSANGNQRTGIGQYINPLFILNNLWRHRELTQRLASREVLSRYQGSFLGVFWSFLIPLLMLGVYTFVFTVIIPARYGIKQGDVPKGEFAVTLFCGLVIFNFFAETVTRAPLLVVGNANYVKKVVFPLEVLPVSVLLANLIHLLISTIILILGLVVLLGHFSLYMLFFPLALLPLFMLTSGLSWIIAAMGVYIRDISQIIVVAMQFLMFMTPIFYSTEVVPEQYAWVFFLNPLAIIVNEARRAMIWDQSPNWLQWGVLTGATFVFMILGYAWFMVHKPKFADMI